jgi:hypothetical protein
MTSPRRRLLPLVLAAVAAATIVAPTSAWSNGPSAGGVVGDGYGTHDWILDQALKVFGGKVPSWLEVTTARLATDDPDTLFWRTNEHVYMEAGYGRGAVHQVVEYYNKAVYHLLIGDRHQAAIDIGRLSHYWADMFQPYHTAYAAGKLGSEHAKYEALVDAATRHVTDSPDWMTADRSPSAISNIRTFAIAAAGYSRAKFSSLHTEFAKNTATLSPAVRTITGYVLKKASRDLADIIYSIGKAVGNAPVPAKIVVSRKYSQPTTIEYQAFYVKVTDASGKVIEGAQVDVAFPTSATVPTGAQAPGAAHTFRAYTMPDGVAKATAWIDLSLHGKTQSVKVTVTSRYRTLTATTSYTAK